MEGRRRKNKRDPGRNRQTYTGAKTKLIIINSVVYPGTAVFTQELATVSNLFPFFEVNEKSF
jgi:hypothetical protein